MTNFWCDVLVFYGWCLFLFGLIISGLLRAIRKSKEGIEDFIAADRRKIRVARIFYMAFPITAIIYAMNLRDLPLHRTLIIIAVVCMIISTLCIPSLVALAAFVRIKIKYFAILPCTAGAIAIILMIYGKLQILLQ